MSLATLIRPWQPVSCVRCCTRCWSSYKAIKRPQNRNPEQTSSGTGPASGKPAQASPGDFMEALRMQIKAVGPMTVADYMRRVLTNPSAGYYMHKDVFGTSGDYVTSPEINQVFGELIAVWCLMEWEKIGSPTPLQVVELGPGRGTMILDILRVLTRFQLQKALSIHLVEVSPYLAEAQARRLCYKHSEVKDPASKFFMEGETVTGISVFWYKQLEDVPSEFSLILAHEFYDALPIHKLQKVDSTWKEILIDVNEEGKEDQFRYVISKNETPICKIAGSLISSEDTREHVEVSTEQHSITQEIADRLESHGGIALIMDYGHLGEKDDTFRSFKNHQLHSPLKDPGTADLTADVDFRQLRKYFEEQEKCVAFGPITQQEFIKRMGGDARIEMLLKKAADDQKEVISSAYKMLTEADQMGQRFKFLAAYPRVLKDHLEKYPPTAFADK